MRQVFRLGFAASTTFLFLIVLSASQTVSAQLIISEFRVRGPNGANDEFIELLNNSGAEHTVAGGGTGYAVAASNGVARCVVPNGTVIPNRGHYLCVNSVGYSLASYPAGNGTTATGDATYTTDIPDNAGIAIFNTSVAGNFILANRLDAVGSTSEANTLYKEGTGYPALTPFSIDYSFYRKIVGTCTNAPNNCGLVSGSFPIEGVDSVVQDTNNNAVDFVFVDTNGTSAGAGQRLGAPGPENLSSPVVSDSTIGATLLDTTVSRQSPPNRQRDGGAFCAPPNPVVPPCVPALNSTFGTISLRRRFTNNTGLPVIRLRFRIVDQTTFPAVSGVADLRNRTSSAVVIATINDPATCAAKIPPEAAPCSVTVQGTTLETPPSQPNGSAYNSTMSAGTVTLATPILPGGSINVQFLFGIQQMGAFRAYVHIEALTDVVGPITPPDGQAAVKKQKWTNWNSPSTGITDAAPVTPLVPGSTPGWFLVVPSISGSAPSTTDSEENKKKPGTKKAANVPAALDHSTSLSNETTPETRATGSTSATSPITAPDVITPALVNVAASGSSTSPATAAASANPQNVVSSAKERRKNRRLDARARRKSLRNR